MLPSAIADKQRGTGRSSSAVSIIVPVWNEAQLIRRFLAHTRQCAPAAEIIVADGGSDDGSVDLAAGSCNQLVISARRRAAQMNAGARIARGDVLWFLHVDLAVPLGSLDQITAAIARPGVVGGFFRVRLSGSPLIYRLTDSFAHYAGLLLGIRCGDHGFFCRREVFEDIGGFPDVSLMEDVDFFRKLRRAGKVAVIADRIMASPRRFELIGRFRLTFFFGVIWLLYLLGAPRHWLQTIYRRWCCRSGEHVCSSERIASCSTQS